MKLFSEWLIAEDINKVTKVLTDYLNGRADQKTMQVAVYNHITQNDATGAAVAQQAQTNPAQWNQARQTYGQILTQLTTALSQINWQRVDGSGWIQWYRNGVQTGIKQDDQTPKRYITVAPESIWKALQALPVLARYLNGVQTQPQMELIGFKIASDYTRFVANKDSIVIHYYDPQAKQQIETAVQSFIRSSGISVTDRATLGRSDFGADANNTSDSDVLANRIMRNIDANRNTLMQQVANPMALTNTLQHIVSTVTSQATHRTVV